MGKSRAFAIEPSSPAKSDGLTQAERFQRIAQEMGCDDGELPLNTRTQAQKFEDAARDLGIDGDEDAFKGVLRKLAKPKG